MREMRQGSAKSKGSNEMKQDNDARLIAQMAASFISSHYFNDVDRAIDLAHAVARKAVAAAHGGEQHRPTPSGLRPGLEKAIEIVGQYSTASDEDGNEGEVYIVMQIIDDLRIELADCVEALPSSAPAHEREPTQLNKAPTTYGMSNGDLIAALTEEAVNCSHYVQTDAVPHFRNYRKYRREILVRMQRASATPRIPDELRKLSDISTHGEWIALEQIPGGYFYCIEHDERAIANNIRYAEAHFIIAAVNYIRAQIAKEDADAQTKP